MGSPENYHNIPELYISINEEEKNEGMPYIFGSRLFYHTKMNNMAEKKAYRRRERGWQPAETRTTAGKLFNIGICRMPLLNAGITLEQEEHDRGKR